MKFRPAWRRSAGGRALFAALMLAAIGPVAAQSVRTGPKLTDLQGIVLVSGKDALVAASDGQVPPVGARIVTTAGARVTVSYATGCAVKLEENRRFVVRESGECAALNASVEVLLLPAGAGKSGAAPVASGADGGRIGEVTGMAAAGASGEAVYAAIRRKRAALNISPN